MSKYYPNLRLLSGEPIPESLNVDELVEQLAAKGVIALPPTPPETPPSSQEEKHETTCLVKKKKKKNKKNNSSSQMKLTLDEAFILGTIEEIRKRPWYQEDRKIIWPKRYYYGVNSPPL